MRADYAVMNIKSKLLKNIDDYLNSVTMYRLVIYCLVFILAMALFLSVYAILPIKPLDLLFSTAFLLLTCLLINDIFAKTFGAPTNVESVYITALILALIIQPITSYNSLIFLLWAGILSIGLKYILAPHKKHIFNPVAVSVAITAITINQSASWWVGNAHMMPFVIVAGILITRKIRRADLVLSFFITALVSILGYAALHGTNLFKTTEIVLLYTPLLFFGFIMLTEPITTPPTKFLRIAYGAIVGALFGPFVHIGAVYFTPELSLLAGNIFSYIVSPKGRLILTLKRKTQIAPQIYDFIFEPDKNLKFIAGQYLEWTLAHKHPDNRGIRRYFTIASSPTKQELRIGIKFYSNPSTYKKTLTSLNVGDKIVASQLAGDFVLPRNKKKKLAFIAGGIGITPFRSIVEYLNDKNEKRDITLFFSNKTSADIIYKDIFEKAKNKLDINTIYTLTEVNSVPIDWKGNKGMISEQMIKEKTPDYKKRTFYISGPSVMVDAFKKTLKGMGLKNHQIKTDFFPGFA